MIELPLVFLAGALGSSHCIGMCGGFALAIGAGAQGLRHNLWRQLIYSAGRIFTYATAGALAGYGGQRLAAAASATINVQATLALLAGALLIGQGLLSAGQLPRKPIVGGAAPCQANKAFRSLLSARSGTQVFLAGMFTGMLPCGFVYAFLSLAASRGSLPQGMATMVAFGLGTMPLMLLAGSGGSLLSLASRRRVLQVAAWSLILAGGVSIVRGAGHLRVGNYQGAGCPACQSNVPDLASGPTESIRRQLGAWTDR